MRIPRICIYCSMKRNGLFFHRIIKAAELPMDLDPHRFFLQWYGGSQCLIEQHRGILCFTLREIRFLTEQGVLSVCGEDLVLEQMTVSRAKVGGKITSIVLEAKS